MVSMNTADRALVAALQRREADWIRFLGELVNCDSGTFDKREVDRVGSILAEAINGLGFTTERVPQEQFGDHLIARKPGRGDQRLLFIGHFDTVFPRGTAAARPFTITDDRATGPGVYDMKSGLVVLLAALTALRDAGAQVWDDATFTAIFNSDEEVLSPTSTPIIAAEARQAHTVCVLEPARPGGEYTFVRKGAGMFKLTVTGHAAHSGSQHELGRSAIEELAQKITRLHQLTNYAAGTTVNVGVMRGGERPNVVAAHAECEFDLRVLTVDEAERAQRQFREIAKFQFVPDTTTALTGQMRLPPLPRQRRNELLFSWVQEAGRKLGLDLKDIVSGGGSDGNTAGQFAPLIDGMGARGDGAHSDREFIVLSSLAERAQVLALFLADWPTRVGELAVPAR
jgi:glutamate carboxypeptidase